MKACFFLLFVFTAVQGMAQSADLRQHELFFEQQSRAYQDWLQQTGLSQALRLHEVQVLREGVLLNLQFATAQADSVSALWYGAKDAYEADHLLTLEEALFLKMLRLLDLQSDQALLQIRSDYRGLGTEYFLKIYTEAGHLQTDQNFSKGYFDKIELALTAARGAISDGQLAAGTLARRDIYKRVQGFVEQQYRPKADCPDSRPTIDAFLSMNDKLLVSVSGLCREVLTQQDELLFCRVLKRLRQDCSSVKRESLHFEFDFDETSGRLYCQLDGKYSNDYLLYHGKVRDMDDGFEDFLQAYGDRFLQTLKIWMEK